MSNKLTGDPIIDLALKAGGRLVDVNSVPGLPKLLKPEIPVEPKKRPLRVYWNSNCPWGNSGYCVQTAETVFRAKASGIDIACGCFFGLEGGKISLNGVPMYPKINDPWGVDGCIYHAQDFGADCVITLQDIWPMDGNGLRQIKNWIPYVPIDHEPPPNVVVTRLPMAYRIISMSKFGERELEKLGFHTTYIPHGVNTTVFAPLNRAECRKAMNIPEDIYLFGMVAANKELPSRKGFEYVLMAFKEFHDKNPKSGIYFHVAVEQAGGFNIKEWADKLGLTDCIYYIPWYELNFKVGREELAKIYNTFDCLLAPSIAEGFGVPIIEAQSCGVPVITSDWTSMAELVEEEKTGFHVKIKEKRPSPLGSYFGIPDEKHLLELMEKAATYPWDHQYIRDRILKEYDADFVYNNYWLPFFQMLQEELVDPLDKKL